MLFQNVTDVYSGRAAGVVATGLDCHERREEDLVRRNSNSSLYITYITITLTITSERLQHTITLLPCINYNPFHCDHGPYKRQKIYRTNGSCQTQRRFGGSIHSSATWPDFTMARPGLGWRLGRGVLAGAIQFTVLESTKEAVEGRPSKPVSSA